jgi:hypothetical protein
VCLKEFIHEKDKEMASTVMFEESKKEVIKLGTKK